MNEARRIDAKRRLSQDFRNDRTRWALGNCATARWFVVSAYLITVGDKVQSGIMVIRNLINSNVLINVLENEKPSRIWVNQKSSPIEKDRENHQER